ncbi:MAG: hypothetical protein H7Z72_14950 [Bacteroidetes bacterium]|nr:hypothetical protein [Fibrella sp.]
MITLYQERDFGEKINATFNYAVQQFRSLGMSLLYIAGPVALAAGIATGVYQSNMLRMVGKMSAGDEVSGVGIVSPFAIFEQILSPAYWLVILFTLLSYVLVSLTVYSHLKLYARQQDEPITVGAVWQEVQSLLVGGFGITIITGLAVFAGLLLLIVPGVYLFVPLSLALAIFVFERLGLSAVFSRCFALTRDKWLSTLGLVIVMSIIASIIGMVFSVPAGIVGIMGVAKGEVSSLPLIITQAISAVGTRMLSALVPLALGFQYFNLVERQEGTGLLSAIDSIGTVPAQPRAQDEGTY